MASKIGASHVVTDLWVVLMRTGADEIMIWLVAAETTKLSMK